MINITDVRVRLFDTDSKIKAAVSITLDSCFVIHELKVIEGKTGLFVIMPGRKAKDGRFKDLVHPLNTETRACIQNAVLAAYAKERLF